MYKATAFMPFGVGLALIRNIYKAFQSLIMIRMTIFLTDWQHQAGWWH